MISILISYDTFVTLPTGYGKSVICTALWEYCHLYKSPYFAYDGSASEISPIMGFSTEFVGNMQTAESATSFLERFNFIH